MTKISEHDWELISAFSDGELPEGASAELKRRIETEPELAEALRSVHQMSSALSALKPEIEKPVVAANTNRRPRLWVMGGSFAAALALLAVLFVGAETKRSPHEIHRAYLLQSFEVDALAGLRTASGQVVDGFPDLTAANLTLAVTNLDGDIASAHYVGANGCRLTVLYGKGDAPMVPSVLQASHWAADNDWYLALATGMDKPKFNTVSEFLRQTTLNRLGQPTVLAMQEAVSTAAPCVIG